MRRLLKNHRPWEQRGVIAVGRWGIPTQVDLIPAGCKEQGCEVHAGYVPITLAYQMWHVGPSAVFESGPIEDNARSQHRVDLWGQMVHAEDSHAYDASLT